MKLLGLDVKRLNRRSYFLTVFISMFLFVGAGLLMSEIFNAVLGPFDATDPGSPHPLGLIPFMILWYVYFGFCTVKRFHDMEINGWWTITAFVPYINLVTGLLLVFKPGTKEKNKYGEKPQGILLMGIGRKIPKFNL